MKQKILAIMALIFLILLNIVMADNLFPIYVRNRIPNTVIELEINYTTDRACSDVIFSDSQNVALDNKGTGFMLSNITAITITPSFICEYEDNVLVAVHQWNKRNLMGDEIIFNDAVIDNLEAGRIGINSSVNVSTDLNVERDVNIKDDLTVIDKSILGNIEIDGSTISRTGGAFIVLNAAPRVLQLVGTSLWVGTTAGGIGLGLNADNAPDNTLLLNESIINVIGITSTLGSQIEAPDVLTIVGGMGSNGLGDNAFRGSDISITAGQGGTAQPTLTGGVGGDINLTTGDGGTGQGGAKSGNIHLETGTSGAGITVRGNSGNIELIIGELSSTGAGGTLGRILLAEDRGNVNIGTRAGSGKLRVDGDVVINDGELNISGSRPAGLGNTNAEPVLIVVGGTGQSGAAPNGIAGNGSHILITSGAGGNAVPVSGTGGVSGNIELTIGGKGTSSGGTDGALGNVLIAKNGGLVIVGREGIYNLDDKVQINGSVIIDGDLNMTGNFTGNIIYGNLNRGGNATITPNNFNVSVGTHDSGDISSVKNIDGNTLDISETIGSPAWNIIFNFTNFPSKPRRVEFVGRYDGSVTHEVEIRIFNFTSGAYVDINSVVGDIPSTDENRFLSFMIDGNTSEFLSDGLVSLQLIHPDAGNINHDIFTDFISLTPSSQDLPDVGQFVQITNYTTGKGNGVIVDAGKGNMTIQFAGDYRVTASSSFASAANSFLSCSVFKNNVEDIQLRFLRKINVAGDIGSAALGGVSQNLVSGDVLNLRCSSQIEDSFVTFANLDFDIERRTD